MQERTWSARRVSLPTNSPVEKLPEGWSLVEVAGVATDSRDRVYVFNRGEHPLMVFDPRRQGF